LRLTHHRLARLRLRLFCARGWEKALAHTLITDARAEGLRFRCKVRRAGRIDVRWPASVVQLLRRLGPPPPLAAALDEYEAATALCRRGLPVDPALRARLAAACRRVMALFPHPPGASPFENAAERE
jgi:hypothetical protein